jgi:EAL domain-containing protein (putative c-di-GMP-specific phosphodiesterase class I)
LYRPWVLREGCTQAARWQAAYPDTSRSVSLNVSASQLESPDFVAELTSILAETRVDPSSVILEITESVLMHNISGMTRQLGLLKRLGVRIAIDDFGTGYSSLAYIRELPIDILKIDRAFVVAASGGSEGGEAVVRAILDLSRILHLDTIAEGIECEAQAALLSAMGCDAALLSAMGCDAAQGYLFARPMPADDVTALIAAGVTPVPAIVAPQAL